MQFALVARIERSCFSTATSHDLRPGSIFTLRLSLHPLLAKKAHCLNVLMAIFGIQVYLRKRGPVPHQDVLV